MTEPQPYLERIATYYDTCDVDYKLLWHLNTHMAMHYGYWDETTDKLREALVRMNEKLAGLADIRRGHRVLDAGCGVGGSSIYLAKIHHANVRGISLSEKQIKEAKLNASENNVEHRVQFEMANYLETPYEDETFDVVWAIESSCYAQDKSAFLEEASRILKPGGKIVVADFFWKAKNDIEKTHEAVKTKFVESWVIDDFDYADTFRTRFDDSGFQDVQMIDISNHVEKSIKRLYLYYYPGLVCSSILKFLGLRSEYQHMNMYSTLYQYKAYKLGLWGYYHFCGVKPS